MRFRPCIDLRNGRVVQIVGGSLSDNSVSGPETHFETDRAPADYASIYRKDGLYGGHVISLGPGNHAAVLAALQAFPGGFHAGGGITPENAEAFLAAGASHVIVTSYVFTNGQVDMDRLNRLVSIVGKNRLVLDLSCRRKESAFWIVTNRWQTFTKVKIDGCALTELAEFCDEFLVHGVDAEGRMQGIEADLIRILAAHSPIPVTYAGGAKTLSDLDKVKALGKNRVDLTIGSALDLFGGPIPYSAVVEWHRKNA